MKSKMSITLSTAKSLAQNPGLHRDPFIRPDLLLFDIDFRDPDPAVWKVGLVSGQVATAKDFNAGSPIVSDAQWSAHPSGVGISLTQSGLLTYNFNMPAFNNTDGIRRTFLAAIGAPWAQDGKLNVGLTLGAAGVFTMEIFSTNAQNALAVAYSNPLGPGLQITSHTGHSCLFVLTGNGEHVDVQCTDDGRTDYTISNAPRSVLPAPWPKPARKAGRSSTHSPISDPVNHSSSLSFPDCPPRSSISKSG